MPFLDNPSKLNDLTKKLKEEIKLLKEAKPGDKKSNKDLSSKCYALQKTRKQASIALSEAQAELDIARGRGGAIPVIFTAAVSNLKETIQKARDELIIALSAPNAPPITSLANTIMAQKIASRIVNDSFPMSTGFSEELRIQIEAEINKIKPNNVAMSRDAAKQINNIFGEEKTPNNTVDVGLTKFALGMAGYDVHVALGGQKLSEHLAEQKAHDERLSKLKKNMDEGKERVLASWKALEPGAKPSDIDLRIGAIVLSGSKPIDTEVKETLGEVGKQAAAKALKTTPNSMTPLESIEGKKLSTSKETESGSVGSYSRAELAALEAVKAAEDKKETTSGMSMPPPPPPTKKTAAKPPPIPPRRPKV